eukprot:CFRG1533T1
MTETVLLTGTSGFIALNILKLLLEAGEFKVRGTVRNLSNTERNKPIENLVPDAKFPVELVEADLTSDKGWDEAVKGCHYILHTASPFFSAQGSEGYKSLVKPALEGTERVLKAAAAHGSIVKRIVLTSSIGSIAYGVHHDTDYVYTEQDWTNTDEADVYYVSKTLAEKRAWEFVEKNKGHKFELATINPGLVVGKYYGHPGTSVDLIKDLLNGKFPMIPSLNMASVDVYDVALAHIKAMTVPEAAGERFILSARDIWVAEIAKILDDEFRPQGYKLPTRMMPYFVGKLLSFFMPQMKTVMLDWGKTKRTNNDKVPRILGVQYTDLKKSIVNTAYCLIEKGAVPKTSSYTGPKNT